jgi:putative nucleotidyltransferase with HDIG domain
MELSRNVDSISIDQVVDVIQNDPSAVTRILRVVNSAYYGIRAEVNSIRRAVIILGPEAVLGIVMSMSLIDLRTNLDVTTTVPFLNLVRHSIATAFIARHLVSISPVLHEVHNTESDLLNEAFTIGLLHDFGKIVLLHNFPEQAADLYGQIMPPGISDKEALAIEREVFGFHHAETGGFLMQELKFPSAIAAVVERHHNYHDATHLTESMRTLLHLIVVSNRLANTLEYDFNHSLTLQEFKDDDVLDLLIEDRIFDVSDKDEFVDLIMGLKNELDKYVNEVV